MTAPLWLPALPAWDPIRDGDGVRVDPFTGEEQYPPGDPRWYEGPPIRRRRPERDDDGYTYAEWRRELRTYWGA